MQHIATYFNQATPEEQHAFRVWIKSMLHAGPVKITFRKVSGEERVIYCTLEEGVAVPHEKTTDRIKKQNDDVCPVWDIDKGAWRSFRYDSITKVQITIEGE